MHISFIENGKFVFKKAEDVHFDEAFDVCVAGLGTAGAICALSASKNGLKTIGIEKCKKIGGLCVNGGVCSYFYGNKDGISKELTDEEYTYLDRHYITSCTDRNIADGSSPELKNYILNEKLKKYNCTVMVDTDICGIYSKGRNIIGVRTISNGKIVNITAKVFVDCSSSAVIARSLGCEINEGRKYDGKTMRFSKAVGRVTNDIFKDLSCGWFHYDYTHLPDKSEEYRTSGTWNVFGLPDHTSIENYCKNLLMCSSVGPCNTDMLTQDQRPYYVGAMFGERESYHVVCDKTLTLADVIESKSNNTPLFYTFSPLDCTNHDFGFEIPIMQDWRLNISDLGFCAGIEKEHLIAKDADNLLVAGKILGVDHSVAGGVRMRADMEKSGEVAASIAFVSVKNNCSIRNTDTNEILNFLKASGCNNTQRSKFANLTVSLTEKNLPFEFVDDDMIKYDFENKLCSHSLWKAAYIWDETKKEKLSQWIKTGSDTFRLNCAIALGMGGSEEGKEILTDFINKEYPPSKDELAGGQYAQIMRAMSIAQRFGWTEVFNTAKKSFVCYATNIFPENPIKFRIYYTSIIMGYFAEIYQRHTEYRNEILQIINSVKKPKDPTLKYIYSTVPFIYDAADAPFKSN